MCRRLELKGFVDKVLGSNVWFQPLTEVRKPFGVEATIQELMQLRRVYHSEHFCGANRVVFVSGVLLLECFFSKRWQHWLPYQVLTPFVVRYFDNVVMLITFITILFASG